jgi:hypothetical protein
MPQKEEIYQTVPTAFRTFAAERIRSPCSRCTARGAGAIGPVSVLRAGRRGIGARREPPSLKPPAETTAEATTPVHPAGPCARRHADAANDAWSKLCDRCMALAVGRRGGRARAWDGAAVRRSVARLPADGLEPVGAPGSAPAKLALCRRTPSAAGSACGSKPLGTPLAAGAAIAHLRGWGLAWMGPGWGLGQEGGRLGSIASLQPRAPRRAPPFEAMLWDRVQRGGRRWRRQ